MAKNRNEYITEGWQLFAEGKPRPSELAAVSWQSRAVLQGWDEARQNAQDEAAVKKTTVVQAIVKHAKFWQAPKVQRDLKQLYDNVPQEALPADWLRLLEHLK